MQRNTVQRQIILDAIKNLKIHPTVDEVYEKIKSEHPAIGKTTVYRNLRQLAQNGEIGQVTMPYSTERYDKRSDPHYHFKCDNCGQLFDVDMDYLEDIDEIARRKYGFQIHKHDVIFKGFCPDCIEKNKEE